LADFPSGSSINYYEGNIYLIGDDANNLLVLDNRYQQVDSIPLFDFPVKRIPKSQKADFETSTLIEVNGVMKILILGSASREERKKAMLLPLMNPDPDINKPFLPFFYNASFFAQYKSKGIEEVNIEGATTIGDYLVLGNRGNTANPINHLIFTNNIFSNRQNKVSFYISKIVLPVQLHEFAGVSELCYVESKDILLFTFSSETTNNSYDDGTIGDSYIGLIYDISHKLQYPELILDEMINLSAIDKDFENEKIEGICVEAVNGNELILHLVSDNDGGESKLFNVKVVLPV
jgi:hypothetical protein